MSKPQKSRPLQTALIAMMMLVLIAGIIALLPSLNRPPSPSGQAMTMDPAIIANLTQIPDAPSLKGADAQKWENFYAQIVTCPDYSTQRRSQMERYINWIINPSQIPPQLIILFGVDTRAGLIRAMAADTSTEWRLKQRPDGSCLIDIGRQLNEMLVNTGQQPFTVYDE